MGGWRAGGWGGADGGQGLVFATVWMPAIQSQGCQPQLWRCFPSVQEGTFPRIGLLPGSSLPGQTAHTAYSAAYTAHHDCEAAHVAVRRVGPDLAERVIGGGVDIAAAQRSGASNGGSRGACFFLSVRSRQALAAGAVQSGPCTRARLHTIYRSVLPPIQRSSRVGRQAGRQAGGERSAHSVW